MENPNIDIQHKYLRKIFRELALLNIFIFVAFLSFAVIKFFDWIA